MGEAKNMAKCSQPQNETPSFFHSVYRIVEQIPFGKVISYGQIARMLGNPRAARQVGWAIRHCPEVLPWQRVVMSDGAIAGGMHAEIRKAMLEAEGIVFTPEGKVDMALCRWDPFSDGIPKEK